MRAITLKGRVKPGSRLEWRQPVSELPEGNVQVTLTYEEPAPRKRKSPRDWPVLKSQVPFDHSLRREDLYGDDGR